MERRVVEEEKGKKKKKIEKKNVWLVGYVLDL